MKTLLLFFALAASALAQTVRLDWTPSITPGITGNNIYRKGGACASGGGWSKINTANVVGATYTDSPGVGTFCYRVTALLGAFESVPSNTAESTVTPAPPTGLTTTLIVALDFRDGVHVATRLLEIKPVQP